MATKPAAKKVPAPKTAAAKKAVQVKKPAARKASAKINQGDLFYCETCGMEVVVNDCGEIAVTPNFICCEEVMTFKPAKAKVAKKTAK
jgi:hypothetical protein